MAIARLARMRFLSPPTPAGTSALRVKLCYLWRHHRLARLGHPRLLTEWVQHRKLHDRNPKLPLMADKVRAKDEVTKLLGEQWVIPTLWYGGVLPARPAWPFPYVVKSRHGSQHVQIVRSDADHRAAVTKSREWMKQFYGAWLNEWLYGQIPRGLLVEPFIGTGTVLPIDFKLYISGGKVRFIQVHLDRAGHHRWIVPDRNWKRVSRCTGEPDPQRPATLKQMIIAAERLGADFPFVRADFYEVDNQPLFGELTFYPGSGLDKVEPRRLDLKMGMLWAAAAAAELGETAVMLTP